MKRIVLDTNFLLAVSQFHIDIFSELERILDFPYKIYVVDKTIDELNKVLESGGKGKSAAKLALDIIKGKAEVIKGLNPGEKVVVEGIQKLRPGAPVKMAPPEAAAPYASVGK